MLQEKLIETERVYVKNCKKQFLECFPYQCKGKCLLNRGRLVLCMTASNWKVYCCSVKSMVKIDLGRVVYMNVQITFQQISLVFCCCFFQTCSKQHSKIFIYIFIISEKTGLDISCELSAKQTIHMKCQNFFFLKKYKKKSLICCSCDWPCKG